MHAVRPAEILRQLEQSGAPDADLLARFIASKDAGAFAELVRRHGALVLGVCRRVTGHPQDAEDAFQAAFLVLAQKAGSLQNAALLGNWLYGVAFRVARRAKRSALRRRTREVLVSALPEPPAPPAPTASEVQPILDEELAALPEYYRDAIVLCDLRGASREEAAAALGIPEGTLSSRLATGRKKLAARLTKRGVGLSVAALPLAVATAQAVVTLPNELVTKTCGLVTEWAASGVVPGSLARLAEGGLAVRKTLLLGAVMVVAVTGAVFAARPDAALPVDPPKAVVGQNKEPIPLAKDDPKPADKPVVAYASAPRMLRAFDSALTGYPIPMWNATGTHLALMGAEVTAKQDLVEPGKQPLVVTVPAIQLYSIDGKSMGRPAYPSSGASLTVVLPDGTGIVTDIREYQLISGHHQLKFWTIKNPPSGVALQVAKTIELDLPETHGYAFAPDMKTYRTVAWERSPTGGIAKIEVLDVDATTGRSIKSLLKLDHGQYAMSANGKRLAVLDKDFTKVTVYDLDRGSKLSEFVFQSDKFAELPGISRGQFGGGVEAQANPVMVFSPNGSRLVISRAVGQNVVINADTGEALPALEGVKEARTSPETYAFTNDGRLLAMTGMQYKPGKRRVGGGFQPPGGGKGPTEQIVWESGASFLTVWDTQTGKALKTWNRGPQVAFNPARPLLAILESNGEGTRVGFWDFAAEVEKK